MADRSFVRFSKPLLALLVTAALVACSQKAQSGGGALPMVVRAAATPPVTAPVKIPYPYVSKSTTTTYSGPSGKPKISTSTDKGTIIVEFFRDKKTGIYDVPEIIKSKLGYTEVLDSAIAFPPSYKGGTAQIILSDNFTYTAGSFVETGLDTYPKGEDSIEFPLTTGRKWSAAAAHLSSTNQTLTGKGAFSENTSVNVAADGTYTGQTSFSSTSKLYANQDNYASTTAVVQGGPSTYTLSMRAAGFNQLTQSFALPSGGKIVVRSTGKKPLPVKKGSIKVPDWYPAGGSLPNPLYFDNFSVAGSAAMPAACKSHAGSASTKVIESFGDLDPVQGFYDTYTATYYMAPLARGQFWFACIIEAYEDDTYANGWVFSAGKWGGLTSKVVGAETLIAAKISTPAISPSAVGAVPVIPFPSIALRELAYVHR
jgi:hypothetical protein